MKAIVLTRTGGPEVLKIQDRPDPSPDDGDVLIRIEAFGLNHAETYFRSGRWPGGPEILGIECAGTVMTDTTGRHAPGTRVVALMGGMGRSRNGTYAEMVTVPATNTVRVETSLSWTDLVAIPEVYATAWSGLRTLLGVLGGETVLVRGATSAVGQAAVNLAVDLGATTIATTRNPDRAPLVRKLGASTVLIDDGDLSSTVVEHGLTVDAVLDLVGNSALRDSLALVRPKGRVCQIGFLGGLAPVDDFNPMADLPSGVQLSFFGSFVLGSPAFPVSDLPLQELVTKAERGIFKAKPVRVFAFDEVAAAHALIEEGQAVGKLAVSVRGH